MPEYEDEGRALDHAAHATGASRRNAQTAKALKEHAPDLYREVRAGGRTLNSAVT